METKPVLGYWGCRGMCEPIRLLLHYLRVDFEDKIYFQGGPPDYDSSSWEGTYKELGMAFPNLPYFIDEHVKISESLAILQYVATKYSPELCGENLSEKGTILQLAGVVSGIRLYLGKCCYQPDFNANNIVADIVGDLGQIASFLGEKRYLLGEKLIWPDFYLAETLDMVEDLKPGTLEEINHNLVEYKQRIKDLDGVREYVSQKRLPYNSAPAQWSNGLS